MNGSGLAPALLMAATGLALSFASSKRALAWGLGALLVAAAGAALVHPPQPLAGVSLAACWLSVVVLAASVHLPRGLGVAPSVLIGVNSGLWTGLVAGGAGGVPTLLAALPWSLLCVPGWWLVARRWGVAIKVVLSWLAAAAVLSIGLGLTPTLGYEPDHRE